MVHEFRNQSSLSTFILVEFSEFPHLQAPLFLLFVSIYTVTLVGNLDIILVRRLNPKLQTPMYFFLSHLSFLDICYSSVITPKVLEILVVEDRTISFNGCMTQFFFSYACVITEMFMLAVMAYDQFVAMCNPLLYTVAMSHKFCALLVAGTYIWGGLCSMTLTYSLMACFIISTFNEACNLLIIMASYVFIVATVIRMPSKGDLHKAFSTCTSHLTAISIFHGIILLLYCVPHDKNSWLLVKVESALNAVMIPMLNPLITKM
ncbi:Olfactory receptor 5D13 [Sciurus carolinensis]|uniref:Olfactory receptor 5D13 n=1 Tax=Sciurus carolinensis TaxID=30640 RepID=A0AA41MC88_SCICA|nr:Olfactory receptor 5D13 [Sciurus carolinensis]